MFGMFFKKSQIVFILYRKNEDVYDRIQVSGKNYQT